MSDISGATVNTNDIVVDISGAAGPAAPVVAETVAVAPVTVPAPEAATEPAPAAPEAAPAVPEAPPAAVPEVPAAAVPAAPPAAVPEAPTAPAVPEAAAAAIAIRVPLVAGNWRSCGSCLRVVAGDVLNIKDLSGVDLSDPLPAIIAKFTKDLSGSNIQDIIRALPQIAATVQALETKEPVDQKLQTVAKALIAACVPEAHRAEADAFVATHLPVVCDILLGVIGPPVAAAAAAAVPKAEQKAEQKAEVKAEVKVVANRNWLWCL